MMKKNIALLFLCFCFFKGFTQQSIPSYPEVLKVFFFKYDYENSNENYLNFAKKKDGWYVQKINRFKSDELQDEMIFWPVADAEPANLEALFDKQESGEKAGNNVKDYLDGSQGNILWIEYQRCRYSGYKGWSDDMIADFGSAENLSDTLLEGLARAYSFKANSYLWYMSGIEKNAEDTLRAKLDRLQLPSEQRLDKVVFNINKSVETYERLEKQNPGYITLIGNVSLRKFNECMNGYMQMDISLKLQRAREFLSKAVLDEHYVWQAKNYLNSCDPNAILFSFGDNDTYQLWYVQQKENFRKDVSVINNSLLGLPSYIQMLKEKKEVTFTTPVNFIKKNISDVTYIVKPTTKQAPAIITLSGLLKQIYLSADKDPEINTIYTTQKVKLSVVPAEFNKISDLKNTGPEIVFYLDRYIALNDLAELDIINGNINKRPICFTSPPTNYFDSSVVQQGIVYRLISLNKGNRESVEKTAMANMEAYTDKVYKPVTSFISHGVKHISVDGNNCFFWQFAKIANYYSEKKDLVTAEKWLNKALKMYPLDSLNIDNMPGMFAFAQTFMIAGDKENGKQVFELYADFLYNKYASPSPYTGYLSKPDLLTELHKIKSYLEHFGLNRSKVTTRIDELEN